MRAFALLSTLVVAATAAIAARLAAGPADPPPARCAALAACFALALQPTQAEHLPWSFEIGWFLVNLAVVANAALTERPDTPARLIAYAATNAGRGSELDTARLGPFAATYRALAR